MSKVIEYQPSGVCCQVMQVQISDDGIVEDAAFFGGCNGNLQGIKSLIKGMKIEDVIEKLKGISCNGKPTSCPDQLAQCLISYKSSAAAQ
ncbi:TIGR03905 family TSCPD domain-containing protein [bacterium]|nr:TIGR03905 family TSCPD domain-containing protein [bacterium]